MSGGATSVEDATEAIVELAEAYADAQVAAERQRHLRVARLGARSRRDRKGGMIMEPIVVIEGSDLRWLLDQFAGDRTEIYKVRVAIDGGGVKVKVNESIWTPPLGEIQTT